MSWGSRPDCILSWLVGDADVAAEVVPSQPEYGIWSNWPPRLISVRCSETKAKSKELDTNLFLLILAKFSRIWGEGGFDVIFHSL